MTTILISRHENHTKQNVQHSFRRIHNQSPHTNTVCRAGYAPRLTTITTQQTIVRTPASRTFSQSPRNALNSASSDSRWHEQHPRINHSPPPTTVARQSRLHHHVPSHV